MRIFFGCFFFGRRFGKVEHSRIVLISHFILDGVIEHLVEDLFQGQLNVMGRMVRYAAPVDKGAIQQSVLDMGNANGSYRHVVQVVCVLPFMMAMLWAQEIMSAETMEEAKALYERCPRLLKEKVKAILVKSGFEEIAN